MVFIDINMNMEEFIKVKTDVIGISEQINTGDEYLDKMIVDIIKMKDYDIVTCDEELLDLIYKKKYNEEQNADAMGLNYTRGSERAKIFLCRDRIKKFADNNNLNINQLYKKAFMHELGHHIFKFTNLLLSINTRRNISEGLANYFVYLISDDNDRLTLEKTTDNQADYYKFYKEFCNWEKVDRQELNYALAFLINGQQDVFLSLFLRYLLIAKKETDDILLEVVDYISSKDSEQLYNLIRKDLCQKLNYELLKQISYIYENLDEEQKKERYYILETIYKASGEIFRRCCIKENYIEINEVKKLSGSIPITHLTSLFVGIILPVIRQFEKNLVLKKINFQKINKGLFDLTEIYENAYKMYCKGFDEKNLDNKISYLSEAYIRFSQLKRQMDDVFNKFSINDELNEFIEYLQSLRAISDKSICSDISTISSMMIRRIDFTKGEEHAKQKLERSNVSRYFIESCLEICRMYTEYLSSK